MDKTKKITVSAIVPVFNEEKTVAGVVKALLESPLIDQVIAVNDGSTDRSREILKGFKDRIVFLNFRNNRGKGFAMAKGIRKAGGKIVTFWDADNTNLNQQHIRSLIEPILTEKAQVVLGYRVWKQDFISPFRELTGQRAYYREDLLPHLKEIARSRFGVEVYLNDVLKNRKTIRIPWRDLGTLQKYQKFDSKKAVQEYVKEGVEIAQTVARRGLVELKDDWKTLQKLSKSNSLEEIKKRAQLIENPRIRRILNDYVFRYLNPKK
jgi:glycosyltransferase involved in cell wall biosynthesis